MHFMSSEKDPSWQERTPLYNLKEVSFQYPDRTYGLTGISLEIFAGDRIGLVGRNGSGKTTLVKHLNGLHSCQQGAIDYLGQPLNESRYGELRLATGMLFQDPDDHLFCNSLSDDIAFGPMNQGLDQVTVNHRVEEQLAAVGLTKLRYKPAHLLSYGQKKRAAFASIMAMKPEVLILDEPTANLDPRQEKIFQKILRDYPGTLIIIDHDLLFLYDLCDRAVVMSEGTVHHDYSFAQLVSQRAALREHGLDFSFRFTGVRPHSQPHRHQHYQDTHIHDTGNTLHLPARGSAPPLMELQHYSFRYHDGTIGLDDANLIVGRGDHLAIIGENGAGKSTLAACLLGLNRGEGNFFVEGQPMTNDLRKRLWRRVGMVFQNSADQLFTPSCREEVAFGPRQMGIKGDELDHRVSEALAYVNLQGFEDKVPLNMSGGERKRLAIAAALSMRPEMLILDEPTASLDPNGEELLIDILGNLDITTILITHDLFFIDQLSSRAIVMHQGKIVRDYSTTEFLTDDHLQTINGLDYSYKSASARQIIAMQDG
ncbi:MAG: ABC transporter ATP-binding protein [Desulfopila sp.]